MPTSKQQGQQAERFLAQMNQMGPAAQSAFRAIYEMAPHPHRTAVLKGDHVRLAMVEALRHPDVAYWVRLNLSVRIARKLAQTTGAQETVRKLKETLEAFHVAADAYVLHLSLSVSQAQRAQQSLRPEASTAVLPPTDGIGVSAEEVALIQSFKRQVIPGLAQRLKFSNGGQNSLLKS